MKTYFTAVYQVKILQKVLNNSHLFKERPTLLFVASVSCIVVMVYFESFNSMDSPFPILEALVAAGFSEHDPLCALRDFSIVPGF